MTRAQRNAKILQLHADEVPLEDIAAAVGLKRVGDVERVIRDARTARLRVGVAQSVPAEEPEGSKAPLEEVLRPDEVEALRALLADAKRQEGQRRVRRRWRAVSAGVLLGAGVLAVVAYVRRRGA